MCEAKELLAVRPITEAEGPLSYSERTMRVVGHTILGQMNIIEPRSVFTRKLMQGLEPWVNVHPREGKMTKRLAAYLHDHYNFDLSQGWISAIGNFLSAEAPTGKFYYDITNKLNWSRGDFGDHDSCFMGGRINVLRTIEDEGGFAMRYWREDKKEGTGRAWLMPGPEGLPIMFNAYGPSLRQFTARLQIILPGVPVTMIKLMNKQTPSGDLYINCGMGALIGMEAPDFSIEHDFEVETNVKRRLRCQDCQERCGADGSYVHKPDENGEWNSMATHYVCRRCVQNYSRDDYWRELFPTSSLRPYLMVGHQVYGPNGYQIARAEVLRVPVDYIEHVFLDRYRCPKCKLFAPEGMRAAAEGGAVVHICLACAAEHTKECGSCGTYLRDDGSRCPCLRTRRRNRGR